MYNISNPDDLIKFKKRLLNLRESKKWTQKEFGDKLNKTRSTVAGWESLENKKIPTLDTIIEICNLYDVDPNYLFGVDDIKNINNLTISETIGLSVSNIEKLKDKSYTNKIIDYYISHEAEAKINTYMKRICMYGYLSQALETTYTEDALRKINSAFSKMHAEVFPIDMNVDTYTLYLDNAFKKAYMQEGIINFIKNTITTNELNNFLYSYDGFSDFNDEKKYHLIISDIGNTTYDYKLKESIIELTNDKLGNEIKNIVNEFIFNEIMTSKTK